MNVFRLTRLRHFSTVAERSSIGLAARVLKISQPALTRSIRRLEAEFGEPLFERSPRGVTLSPLGQSMLPYAQAILAEADRATEDWQNLQGERRASIKLGISPNFVRYVVPEVLEHFVSRFPEANIQVQTGTAEQLLAMLSSAKLDLALSLVWKGTMDAALGRAMDVAQKKLARLTASVYAPKDHELVGRNPVALKELQHQRWAVPYNLSISYVFQSVFSNNELSSPPEILNTSNLSLIVDSCRRLNLLTIVPGHVVAAEVARGDMVPLPCRELQLDYSVSLLTRRRGTHTTGLNYFVELLQKECLKMDIEPGNAAPPEAKAHAAVQS